MNRTPSHNRIMRRKNNLHYWKVIPEDDFTRELAGLVDKAGMSYAELARRVGVSRSYVTKVMQGSANWTVETLTKFALVFDRVPRVHLAPKEQTTTWRDTESGLGKTADVFTDERMQGNLAVHRQRCYSTASPGFSRAEGDQTESLVWEKVSARSNG